MGKRKYDTKKIRENGLRKVRPCLGPGCKRKFLTTPETRICPSCKLKIAQIPLSDVDYQLVRPQRNTKGE